MSKNVEEILVDETSIFDDCLPDSIEVDDFSHNHHANNFHTNITKWGGYLGDQN